MAAATQAAVDDVAKKLAQMKVDEKNSAAASAGTWSPLAFFIRLFAT
jgi:hypothetical protein